MEDPAVSPEGANDGVLRTRRGFLGWLIGSITAFIAAVLGVPAVGALISPALGRRRAESVIRLGKIADYPMGEPKRAEFTLARIDGWIKTLEVRAVWVVRTGDQAVTVYNGHCTHLGCAYQWKAGGPGGGRFLCPCHDGVFALDGRVLSGPPPRQLDTLASRVEDGTLLVTYQDFRLGVPRKVSV